MFAHAWKSLPVVVLLLWAVGGCRSSPPAMPSNVDPHEYNKPVPDNWLFDRLRGRDPQTSQTPPPDSRVVAASATEPVSEGGRTTVVPPAGSADDPMMPHEEEEKSIFSLDNLSPENITKSFKKAIGKGPDEKIARAAYNEGEELYKQQKYAEAIEKFATAISRWPDTPLEEDALFMQAECYFATDQYSKAYDTYCQLLKKYEFSRYLDRSVAQLFKIGRYWDDLYAVDPHWPITPNLFDKKRPMFDTWGYAIKAFEQVRLDDPTGPLADDAMMATGNTYFKYGRFAEAAENYDIIRKEYPKSEHRMDAMILDMKSKQEVYQGAVYDGTPLKDAGDIAKELLSQYPDKLGAEKQHIIQASNTITDDQAERNWQIGQYYDNRAYYGAARIYYQDVIRKYPQTAAAERARTRMEAIKDLPAEPPNHLKWLDELLNRRPPLPPLQEGTPAEKSMDITP